MIAVTAVTKAPGNFTVRITPYIIRFIMRKLMQRPMIQSATPDALPQAPARKVPTGRNIDAGTAFSLSPYLPLFLCLQLALLSGCATQPPVDRDSATEIVPDTPAEIPMEPGETLYTTRLLQAEQLLAERQLIPAASILRGLDDSKLTPRERARALILETEVLYLQGETAAALEGLRREALQHGQLDRATAQALEDWMLRLVAAREGPLAAARLADQLLLLTEDEQRSVELFDLVWLHLQRVDADQLQAEFESAEGTHWRGWLELALLAADVMASPDAQVAQLSLWQQRHPAHRASASLPGGLGSLEESAAGAPRRIALMLPLSRGPGENGRAVLEGFLAAQYLGRLRGWPEQQLMIMDSGDYRDLNTAYRDAVRAGADLVVGPLTPRTSRDWRPDPGDTVPLLTLSWLEPSIPFAAPPAQLDLAPEDEARQLARLAFAGGARNALIVRPDGDWGERVSAELVSAWRGLSGEVRATAIYSGQADYSSSLTAALNLADSEARGTRLRRLLAEPTEFNPRRRRDLDVIFMLSQQPQQARSIKPLLAFHYAGELPVYSTSHIFSGRRDPQRDRDLNGINLVEMPWLLDPMAPLPVAVARGGSEAELADMHALGADAFMLNWRLAQLRDTPTARIRGKTGLLNMDTSGRLHRELVPANFREGVPTATGR